MDCLAAGFPGAAMLGEEGQQIVHGRVAGGVINVTAHRPADDQAGTVQLLEMEAEAAVGLGTDKVGEVGNAQPVWPGLDKAAIDAQPGFMSEGLQRLSSEIDIHIYRIVKMKSRGKRVCKRALRSR